MTAAVLVLENGQVFTGAAFGAALAAVPLAPLRRLPLVRDAVCLRQSTPSSCQLNQSSHASEPSGSSMRAWNWPSTSTCSTLDGTHAAGAWSLPSTSTSMRSPS